MQDIKKQKKSPASNKAETDIDVIQSNSILSDSNNQVNTSNNSDKMANNNTIDIEELKQKNINKNKKKIFYSSNPIYNKLTLKDDGKPHSTISNITTILKNDKKFKGRLKINILKNRFEIIDGSNIKQWDDEQEAITRGYIEDNYNIYSVSKLNDALKIEFSKNKYNPILEKIKSIVWDGIPRVETFFIKYLKAKNNPYSKEISRLTFAGGIKRLIEPGCKFDEVPTLIGKQGSGKSTFVRWLALEDNYFSELSTVEGNKAIEEVQDNWIVEISEMLALTTAKEVEAVKSFITRQNDKYRKPYDKYVTDTLRKCLFIGTTNRKEFLTDKTGNRRFLPLEIFSTAYEIFENEVQIKKDIEQCWAEMYHAYNNKLEIASSIIKPELRQALKDEQMTATEDDHRIGLIAEYLERKEKKSLEDRKVCILEIWINVFDGDKKTLNRKESAEIGLIMQGFTNWEKQKNNTSFGDLGKQKWWKYISTEHIHKTDEKPPKQVQEQFNIEL